MMTEFVTDNQRLRRRERLRGRRNFARVFRRRCSAGDSRLVVYAAANDLDIARIGIIVSRRMGNAVARATVRRRIREFFRKNKREIPRGCDYLCVAKPIASKEEWALAPEAAKYLFARAVKKLASNTRR